MTPTPASPFPAELARMMAPMLAAAQTAARAQRAAAATAARAHELVRCSRPAARRPLARPARAPRRQARITRRPARRAAAARAPAGCSRSAGSPSSPAIRGAAS